MKQFQLFSLTAVGFSMALSACSGGGQSDITNGVNQCPKTYAPINMNVADSNNQKVKWEKLDTIPAGTWVESGAALYYIDPEHAPENNFRVMVSESSSVDEKTKSRSYKAATSCFRGARADLQNISIVAPVISKMVITKDAATGVTSITDVEAREISYTIGADGKTKPDSKAAAQKPGSAADIYGKAAESFIVKKSENELELRLKGEIQTSAGRTGTYYLSITLVR